jgi:phosphate uptake regulator
VIAARHLGATFGPSQTFQAIRFLEKSDRLDRNVVSLLRDLRGLRNEAAHAPDFALGKDAALEYAASAAAVASYLDRMAGST